MKTISTLGLFNQAKSPEWRVSLKLVCFICSTLYLSFPASFNCCLGNAHTANLNSKFWALTNQKTCSGNPNQSEGWHIPYNNRQHVNKQSIIIAKFSDSLNRMKLWETTLIEHNSELQWLTNIKVHDSLVNRWFFCWRNSTNRKANCDTNHGDLKREP